MNTNDGGPAFPVQEWEMDGSPAALTTGLSVRDYFAAKALQGMCANPGGPLQANGRNGWALVNCTSADVVTVAYDFADAMLRARG